MDFLPLLLYEVYISTRYFYFIAAMITMHWKTSAGSFDARLHLHNSYSAISDVSPRVQIQFILSIVPFRIFFIYVAILLVGVGLTHEDHALI